MKVNGFITTIGYVSGISWIISWALLCFKLDIITYIAFIFYGIGISGITLLFAINIIFRILKEKEINKK